MKTRQVSSFYILVHTVHSCWTRSDLRGYTTKYGSICWKRINTVVLNERRGFECREGVVKEFASQIKTLTQHRNAYELEDFLVFQLDRCLFLFERSYLKKKKIVILQVCYCLKNIKTAQVIWTKKLLLLKVNFSIIAFYGVDGLILKLIFFQF